MLRFAALAESYTRFRVDYFNDNGAVRFYYPDFVAVQQIATGKVNWIIETKGRENENAAHKTGRLETWCQMISQQTGRAWGYCKVSQREFDASTVRTFGQLLAELDQNRGTLFNAFAR